MQQGTTVLLPTMPLRWGVFLRHLFRRFELGFRPLFESWYPLIGILSPKVQQLSSNFELIFVNKRVVDQLVHIFFFVQIVQLLDYVFKVDRRFLSGHTIESGNVIASITQQHLFIEAVIGFHGSD